MAQPAIIAGVALVLMESPAIIMAVLLATYVRSRMMPQVGANAVSASPSAASMSLRNVLHEAFTDGAHLLLLGGVLIGYLTADEGKQVMKPFTDLQKGILGFFLLDMGLVAAQRLQDLRRAGAFLISFALVAPLVHAGLGLGLSMALGLNQGDTLLFMVLCASASYIAVPAAMRMTVPEANPSFYISTALGVTFPFNIIVGIPLFFGIAQAIGG